MLECIYDAMNGYNYCPNFKIPFFPDVKISIGCDICIEYKNAYWEMEKTEFALNREKAINFLKDAFSDCIIEFNK